MAPSIQAKDGIAFVQGVPHTPRDDSTYLLLHGLGNSFNFWNAVAPSLGTVNRTVALDIPGFGRSATPTGGFTFDHAAKKISDFSRKLDIRNCIVVGHSLGALVALRLVGLDSTRFKRLILVDGTLGRVVRLLKRPQSVIQHPALGVYVAAQFAGGLLPLGDRGARIIGYTPIIRALTLWPYVSNPNDLNPKIAAEALAKNGGISVAKVLGEACRFDYVTLMQAISQPVDLVWGERDHLINQDDIRQARSLVTVERELEIADCGHWPMIERPTELIDFILSWGDTSAGGAARH